ncbi:unnamed protein product [Mytilus edulis]|uniref:Uncharacterized protein n=1 Tax=Mytilus edulis TaxID=6550 RepID=A0A8S3R878_MYTED|nr:unnamed protein product [Mytilus edulis]
MRLRIKQSRPKGLNATIRLVVELEAYNKAENRTMKSMGHLRHTTSDERTEAYNSPDTVVSIENMATWMQTMEDNLQSLTKEMMTLKDLNSQKNFNHNLLRYQLDQIVVSGKVCLSEGQTLPTNDVLVEASENKGKDYILTACSLVKSNDSIPVRLMNVENEAKTIFPGTTIAQMCEISHVAKSLPSQNDRQNKRG